MACPWQLVPEKVGDRVAREAAAYRYIMATMFIRGLDESRYGALTCHLHNDFIMGTDNYPKDLFAALTMVNLYIY